MGEKTRKRTYYLSRLGGLHPGCAEYGKKGTDFGFSAAVDVPFAPFPSSSRPPPTLASFAAGSLRLWRREYRAPSFVAVKERRSDAGRVSVLGRILRSKQFSGQTFGLRTAAVIRRHASFRQKNALYPELSLSL